MWRLNAYLVPQHRCGGCGRCHICFAPLLAVWSAQSLVRRCARCGTVWVWHPHTECPSDVEGLIRRWTDEDSGSAPIVG